MSDNRTLKWLSGRLISTSIRDFFAVSLTVQDPQIPNLPLETPEATGAPFVPFFWPNPILRKQTGQTDVIVNLLVTTLAVAAVANVPRAPLYTQQNQVARVQVTQPVNLLTNTLAPAAVVAAPFTPEEFPNPVVRRAVQNTFQPVNLLTNTLAPVAVGTPFVPVEWRNPQIKKYSQQIDYAQFNLPLVSYVPYFAQDNQWPNPRLKRAWPPQPDIVNTLPLLTAAPAVNPRAQSYFPDSVSPAWDTARFEQNIKQAYPGDIPTPVTSATVRVATFTQVATRWEVMYYEQNIQQAYPGDIPIPGPTGEMFWNRHRPGPRGR